MDDGSKVSKGLKFSTNSFSYQECIFLTNALYENFNLKATVQKAGAENQYIYEKKAWKNYIVWLIHI